MVISLDTNISIEDRTIFRNNIHSKLIGRGYGPHIDNKYITIVISPSTRREDFVTWHSDV